MRRVVADRGDSYLQRTLTVLVVLTGLVSSALEARADIDRTQFHELPDAGAATPISLTVHANDYLFDNETRKQYLGKPPPTGDYDLYVDADGKPVTVDVIRSIPGCDQFVARNLLAGRQSSRPIHAFVTHYAVTLSFESSATKARNVPPHMLDTEAIAREAPHLPDSVLMKHPGGGEITVQYYVTVGTDGNVSAVDPVAPDPEVDPGIIATLKRWRFKTQAIPIRSMMRFVFTIPPRKWPSRR
jgi:hypothetical protein